MKEWSTLKLALHSRQVAVSSSYGIFRSGRKYGAWDAEQQVIEHDTTPSSQCDILGDQANKNFMTILTVRPKNSSKFHSLEMQLED